MALDDQTSFVRCALCEKLINVVQETRKPVENLTEHFVVRCPHCQAQGLYAEADIVKLSSRS